MWREGMREGRGKGGRRRGKSEGLFFLIYFNWRLITLQYCIGFAIHWHESAMGIHVFPILNPAPTSLPMRVLKGKVWRHKRAWKTGSERDAPCAWRVRPGRPWWGMNLGTHRAGLWRTLHVMPIALGVDELQPEARPGILPITVNKILLEHKHTHSFTPCLLFSYDGCCVAAQSCPTLLWPHGL